MPRSQTSAQLPHPAVLRRHGRRDAARDNNVCRAELRADVDAANGVFAERSELRRVLFLAPSVCGF